MVSMGKYMLYVTRYFQRSLPFSANISPYKSQADEVNSTFYSRKKR